MTSQGVHFPADASGARSTTTLAQHVVSDALRGSRADWAQQAADERSWRSGYLAHFRHLLEAGLPSPEAWAAVASDGLASARRSDTHLGGRVAGAFGSPRSPDEA